MRDFRELNQQVNEVKRMLNSFIQKLTAQVEIFQVHSINLSVAIWVGFLALFGIASDNGVVIATYLDQRFASGNISSIDDIRQAIVKGAVRRIRPCLMTSATSILAL